jgi:hypothetical protein
MKLSTHYCFVKRPRGNLGGLGDSFKTQMKYKRIIVLSKALGGILADPKDF